jgi:CspA family cold shock protein
VVDLEQGTVKLYRHDREFGFIRPDSGGADVFVHARTLAMSGIETLSAGDRVEYERVADNSGFQAVSVAPGMTIHSFDATHMPTPEQRRCAARMMLEAGLMLRAAGAILEGQQAETLSLIGQLATMRRTHALEAAQDCADAGHAGVALAMCDDVLADVPGHPEATEMRRVFATLRGIGE